VKPFTACAVATALAVMVAFGAEAETVRFRSATTPPTPLQQRLAKERGEPVPEQPTTELVGELYRPQAGRDAAGARFAALGYVFLIVDSFGPRGVSQRCTIEAGSTVDRLMDAYGGLLFLAAQPFVDPERIAVVGYSQGAGVVLDAVELGGVEAAFGRRFKTAIAYYPPKAAWADTLAALKEAFDR